MFERLDKLPADIEDTDRTLRREIDEMEHPFSAPACSRFPGVGDNIGIRHHTDLIHTRLGKLFVDFVTVHGEFKDVVRQEGFAGDDIRDISRFR